MSSWDKDQIVLVINQDSRRALTRAKTLQRMARTYHLKSVTCAGADLDYTLRQEMKNKKLKRLIIAGGDGSVAQAARLSVRLQKDIELAIIPIGTANYYSRSLGVRTLQRAFAVAVNGRTMPRYVCEANGRVFMMVADIGVTSRMLDQVTDASKKRFGKLAYAWGMTKLFFTFDPMRVTITANGETNTYATTELLVINHNIEERLQLMPHVHSSDPYFEIVTYGIKNTKLSPIFAMLMLIFSLGKNQKYLKRIKATEATIETDRPEVVSLDGDSLERTPITVKVVKKPLNVVAV